MPLITASQRETYGLTHILTLNQLGEHQVHVPLVDVVLRYGLTASPTMWQP
ncbi:MAG TPA: hypothetical protein VK608_03635 [Edaphobacter sp.]|nr:hypothetical protein [Edaphobacter sp.]